eukprot:TRINITY_DN8019_c0_g1_i1.p1 TRINITY_DN8019_c0_g1~~TRINITY_DN8019_c0_g1_i1.p1  ORF type:complete len:68 (-),score=7.44 TRINITY_DN8019_c0_g1_i1:217-420(-)
MITLSGSTQISEAKTDAINSAETAIQITNISNKESIYKAITRSNDLVLTTHGCQSKISTENLLQELQ